MCLIMATQNKSNRYRNFVEIDLSAVFLICVPWCRKIQIQKHSIKYRELCKPTTQFAETLLYNDSSNLHGKSIGNMLKIKYSCHWFQYFNHQSTQKQSTWNVIGCIIGITNKLWTNEIHPKIDIYVTNKSTTVEKSLSTLYMCSGFKMVVVEWK